MAQLVEHNLAPTKCSQLRGYVLWAVLLFATKRAAK